MTELHYDAFISYASEDVHSAKRLADDLTRHNLSVWIDRASLSGGEQWEASIRYAISQSKLFIILLSPFCVHKHGFIQDELHEALSILSTHPDRRLFILPVRIAECAPPTANPYLMLRTIHMIDLFPSWEQGITKILDVFHHPAVAPPDFEIICFDLGHGESAIMKTSLSSKEEPQPLIFTVRTVSLPPLPLPNGRDAMRL